MKPNLKKMIVILSLFAFVFLLNPFPISAFGTDSYYDKYSEKEPTLKIGTNVRVFTKTKIEDDYSTRGKIVAFDGRGVTIKRESDAIIIFFPWENIGCIWIF